MYSRVLDTVKERAMRSPDMPALVSGTRTLGYGQLWEAIEATAAQWQPHALRVAGLALENSIEWCVADLAALYAGIVLVPLPPFFTVAQCKHALHSAGANGLIRFLADWHIEPLAHPPVDLPPGTAKITFTSGSTGTPKGVCLSQEGMEAVPQSLVQAIGADKARRHMAVLPLAVLLENIAGFYTTLLAGGCYHIEPAEVLGFRGMQLQGGQLMFQLKASRATSTILVPQYAQALLAACQTSRTTLPDLQFAAIGGAKVSETLLTDAHAAGLAFYQGYGLSEMASVVAVNTPQEQKAGSVGRLLPHVRAHVSTESELVLSNPALLGYIGGPVQQGEYASGDAVRMDADGFLFIDGRMDNILVTTNGRNISPEWPESELLAEPGILQTMVVGNAQAHLSALIAAAPGIDIDAALARANARLPEYARITDWRLVAPMTMAEGLITANGRLVRAKVFATHHALVEEMYQQRRSA